MKQIVQNMRSGKMSVMDVPAPQVGRGELLVATKASLISAGTERMLIDFANKSLMGKAQERPDLVKKVFDKMKRDGIASTTRAIFSRLEEPMPLGYSAAGEVIGVGAGLEDVYNVGDRVAMAGAGIANHAEINVVPKNLAVPIPDNVSYEEACFSTVSAIAMHGFRNSKSTMGDRVLVMGLGLVGQLTLQFAKNAGCRVFGMDYDSQRVNLAAKMGADKVHLLSAGNAESLVNSFTEGRGFDSVIICAATDSTEPVERAAEWARDKARIVMTGKTGSELPYRDYMQKELEFIISRSYGPGRYDKNYEQKGQDYPIGFVRWTERENLKEAVEQMGRGVLNVADLITHKFDIDKAESAYEMIIESKEPSLGVVLAYPSDIVSRMPSRIGIKPKEVVSGKVGLGFVGAGAFARGVLLPELQASKEVAFTGILTRGGVTAKTTGEKFGFAFAAGSEEELWNSDSTQAVVVATRHNTHAKLVVDALNAKKHVFVEKPLAMNIPELEQVQHAFEENNQTLMVGFNRRFSPYVKAIQDAFKSVEGPKQVVVRVNAGKLEGDNWQNDPETGGGRLVGEGCHFIDLALYMVGSEPVEVYGVAGQGQDVYTITIRFKDGSLGTIMYTSEGESSFSKERVELYGGGKVGVIDNFMDAFVVQNGKKKSFKVKRGKRQDKGHWNELLSFVDAVKGKAEIDPSDMFMPTRVTLLAEQSMQSGKAVRV